MINGEPYFVGRDVATSLGYSNPNDALAKHVPDKYKLVSQIAIAGQMRNVTLINEAGLYKLVMRSKLPNAEKFSDWVCEEVLPSIRRQGVYKNTRKVSSWNFAVVEGYLLRRLYQSKEMTTCANTINSSINLLKLFANILPR